ncbi:twitch domain-containing radical SAM protein [Flavobacteriales bacterium]|nr:twitch domain-containing radical SAM protein [Flavobacteriales bacterium]
MSQNSDKPYCLMPWIHYHVSDNGKVKACCIANIPLGNVNDDSFEEIWNGESIKNLRTKFLKGEIDKRCSGCYKLEEAGGKSIRQETFEKFPKINPKEIEVKEKPIYFDIRFSNVCNFRCRTCWHGASSKWFQDAKKLGRNLGEKAIINNIDDFDLFISQIGEALKGAKEIYFAGGEPLVTEEHYLLLDWLIENKVTNLKLRYNTNFSILKFKNYSILNYWKQFSHVEILASVDATEKLGELIRKEFDWDLFLKNREQLSEFKNITFKLAPTISILNLAHLPQLYKTGINKGLIEPEDFYINILERPFYYNIKAFPINQKAKIEEEFELFYDWCKNNSIPNSVIISFKECISFMNQEQLPEKYWNQFLKETEVIDSLRGEKLMN